MIKRLRAKWTANPAAEQITSYRVYHAGVLIGEVAGDQTQYDFDLDASGVNEFNLSAVNSAGEGPAAQVTYDLGPGLPSEPTGFLIEFQGTVNVRRLYK